MFKGVKVLIVFFATASTLSATLLPEYTIHIWDKNRAGGLIIGSAVQCSGSNCTWYWYFKNERGMRIRVSNSTVLYLTEDSEYAEYFLLDDQRQSIEEYALVVPNANAGSPFESDFLSLNACQTGILNYVEFRFTININERAITTKQQCDLQWNGLPECAFGDGTCLHNESSSMNKYSVRCHLAIDKENYISSIPVMIGPVDDLPFCPSTGASNITMTSIPTPLATMNTPPVTTTATTAYQSTTSSAATTVTSVTSTLSTTSTAPTTTPETPVNHSSSSSVTVNPQETNTSAAPATTSSEHAVVIAVISTVIAVIILTVVAIVILIKVYLCNKNVKDGSNPNAKTSTKSQPGCQEEVNRNHRWTDLKSYCSCNNNCKKYDV